MPAAERTRPGGMGYVIHISSALRGFGLRAHRPMRQDLKLDCVESWRWSSGWLAEEESYKLGPSEIGQKSAATKGGASP